jgi:hypothetical protein
VFHSITFMGQLAMLGMEFFKYDCLIGDLFRRSLILL